MTKRIDAKYEPTIAAEAYAWVAQIETGDFSDADKTALSEWMGRSPRHAAEIRAAAALSGELAVMTELSAPLASTARAASRRRRPLAFAPVAGALALVAIGAVIYAQFFTAPSVREFYATEIGEYRTIDLADGSVVKLNTNTAVEIAYDGETRDVRLTKGEAFFDVAKDPSRPFIVFAGANAAEAVGTAFSVRLYDDKTELIVTEGVVAFSKLESMDEPSLQTSDPAAPAAQPETSPLLIEAGHEVSSITASSGAALKLSKTAKQRKLSWTEGLFDFSDTPLTEVVREVSRHTALNIHIEDAALQDVKFGGVFRIGDVDTLLDALPAVGVVVDRVSDSEVRLYSAQDT